MSQSVILVSDVPGLGQLGDLCNVKDGYARNYLLPQKLAVFATSDAVKKFEKQKAKLDEEKEKQFAKSRNLSEKLANVGLVFERAVGQGGRLFGSVTPMDIAEELAKQKISVEKKSVLMNGPIRTTGEQTVRIRLHSKVVVDVPVKVVGLETKKSTEHHEHAESLNEIPLQPAPDDY